MDILRVRTERGLELKGAIYNNNNSDTVVIIVTGICSNVFQNDLLDATGKLLQKNNISCIIAHTHDSFSCFAYSDLLNGKQKHAGVFNDDFNMVYQDVEAYVKYAKKELGFKNIILAGHSLGSNKIIHYLGNTLDDFIDYYIVSSPVDIMHWFDIMPDIDKCFNLAKNWVKNNQGDDILPYLFGGFSPMTANTALGFYNAQNLKNCPVLSKKGETKSLNNIKPNGSFVIGSKDSVVGQNPKGFMETINSWTKNPEKNEVIVVDNASHIFFNKHNEYAQIILNIVKEKVLLSI